MNIPAEMLPHDVQLRIVVPDDAEALYRAQLANREHLRPWEPRRAESFFTVRGQAERIEGQVEEFREGRVVPWVLEKDGAVIGIITLSGVVLGPFRSASLGYWVAADQQGRGLAGAAVARVCAIARDIVGLHRIEAGTLLDNHASQRVLEKNGFDPIGMAPRYLHIDGEWRDNRLFQRILHDGPPPGH
ncbi:GNAT family N-acetyltransferase [Streptomyces sp. NPDC048416]|uniref:GNAT family N-acetyltransferase n=1 Tax=Streptomyces sp. NPDC048416 TaxID=3365546 RepID=UPI0037207CE4